MKTIRLLYVCSVVFITICYTQAQQTSTFNSTKYQVNNWKQVAEFIQANWIDDLAKSKDLPFTYVSAWPKLPFMFYWDSYFINEGLKHTKYDSISKNNILNLLYAVNKYGYIGNAFVTNWGMNRSQPPYLSMMVRNWYQNNKKDTAFLSFAYQTLQKEYKFWVDTANNAIQPHSTTVKGLQRYSHSATNNELLELYKELESRFSLDKNIPDTDKIKVAIPFAVEAGTGMDFTTRFEHRCPEFIAVDLNALLYSYEVNFEWMVSELKISNQPNWKNLAAARKKLINLYCWNEERGLFMDYDFVNKRFSKVAAVTSFQPVWAGLASKSQVKRIVKQLSIFHSDWGLVTTEKNGEIKNYQWGESSIWAPMQLMVIQGLLKYGFKKEAKSIATRYLNLITKNFIQPIPEYFTRNGKSFKRQPGKIYEKYTNMGVLNDDEYISSEMMGWTAGTFLWCYNFLQTN